MDVDIFELLTPAVAPNGIVNARKNQDDIQFPGAIPDIMRNWSTRKFLQRLALNKLDLGSKARELIYYFRNGIMSSIANKDWWSMLYWKCIGYIETSASTIIKIVGTGLIGICIAFVWFGRGKGFRENAVGDVYIANRYVSPASEVFIKTLQDELKKAHISTTTTDVSDVTKLDANGRLIFVCDATSRIQADVEGCLEFIREDQYKETVLVILHITGERNLPVLASRIRLHSSKLKGNYKQFYDIIDVGFQQENGIYKCETNGIALRVIGDFCSNRTVENANADCGTSPKIKRQIQ